MRTRWFSAGAGLALALGLAGCGREETPAPAAPQAAAPAAAAPAGGEAVVTIGHVAPLSGAQAHYGKDNENGVRMALEDLNAQALTIGGRRVRFELAAEDDAGDPDLTRAGYPTSFRLIANDNALGAAVALYAADTLKVRRVAVVDDRTAYGQGVAEVFRQTAEARGMEVVDQQFTSDRATDFTAILTAIRAKAPGAIFFGGMDPQAGPMLRQMEQLGLGQVKFLGGDGICTSEIARLAAGARTLENLVCASGGASIEKMPGGAAWKQKYDGKYPGQFQIYSPYTYDATFVLVDAMKRADSTDPKLYVPQLPATDYQGVTGRIRFEPNGEPKEPATTLYTFRNGQKTPLS